MSRVKKLRVFDREFKLRAVQRMLKGEKVSALARELKLRRKLLYEWKARYQLGGKELLRLRGRPAKSSSDKSGTAELPRLSELGQARKRIAELERKIGQQEVELDFFVSALQRIEQKGSLATGSTKSSPRRRRKAE